jgi:2-desacetyl-2-hydroxyethyl bacteriochlorophyllide A dehydrogenase
MQSANIVLTGKQQVELKWEEAESPPPDGLLVRTRLSLISTGTECICYRSEMEEGSHWDDWVRYPFYLGYSNVGQVEEIGPETEGFEVGDRVFSTSNHHQITVARGSAFRIPDGVSDESAAWSKLATIAQTGVRRAELKMGARVVIIGSGPLGQLLTQYARVMGAKEVLVIDMIAGRLAIARDHGATQIFVGSAADAGPFVEEYTDGELADVVFDATGHYAVFPMALKLVRRYGTLMLVGDSPHPSKQVLTGDVITRQISIRGTHNEMLPPHVEEWSASRQVELFHTYVERGQMRVDDLITSRHAPQEAPEVYANLLENREETIGVVFDWSRLGG